MLRQVLLICESSRKEKKGAEWESQTWNKIVLAHIHWAHWILLRWQALYLLRLVATESVPTNWTPCITKWNPPWSCATFTIFGMFVFIVVAVVNPSPWRFPWPLLFLSFIKHDVFLMIGPFWWCIQSKWFEGPEPYSVLHHVFIGWFLEVAC